MILRKDKECKWVNVSEKEIPELVSNLMETFLSKKKIKELWTQNGRKLLVLELISMLILEE